MDIEDTAESQSMNKDIPPPDAPVAVEWWFRFNDDGTPALDAHHGFHDAERVADTAPPAVQNSDIVDASGVPVDADSDREDMWDSRYLYLTHREALSRDITPCVECFPGYATEQKLTEERTGDGILTESGVDGAVFPVWTRETLDSEWNLDSVHESYASLLFRTRAIREHAGAVGGRLRYSLQPIRRCEYTSQAEATVVEPEMAHVTELRAIQPDELPTVRDRLGDEFLSVPVQYEHRYTDTAATRASLVHRAEKPPCGYERETSLDLGEADDDRIDDLLDAESQTVADVIQRGNVVEFCDSCFPDLAAWSTEPDD